MKVRILISAVILLCGATAFAQSQGNILHTPDKCVEAGELPLMNVSTADDGLLRAFFRRVGTTDWCSVDGKNLGRGSSVTLPRFNVDDEFEYYFVVLNGKQVIAKSPQIYRVKATNRCDTPFARHSAMLVMECLPPGANTLANSLNAGYHALSNTPGEPPVQSPEKPERAAQRTNQKQ